MEQLKLIDNDLVPVYETDKSERVVYGTELHAALEVKTAYKDWSARRFNECDATENKDYEVLLKNERNPKGGRPSLEHIIRLDIAKEMAMLERNEIGKRVRKYFIEIENRYKNSVIDLEQLDPQTRLMNLLVQSISKQELEQKRLAKEVEAVKQNQEAIADTFQKTNDTEDFQRWANDRIAQIAESPKFNKGRNRSQNYSLARSESYERLSKKRSCHLDDRVQRAIGRALKEKPDIKRTELQKINKIYIIANDKDLRPAYELVIKEMMIAYCVKNLEGGVE